MEENIQELDSYSVHLAEQRNGKVITTDDIHVLESCSPLTDNIINFELTWLHQNVLPAQFRDRVFVFDTSFYKTLTSQDDKYNRYNEQGHSKSEFQYSLVANFTQGVNLSEKDFIIVPLFMHRWFTAIISLKLSEWPEVCQAYEISGDDYAIITNALCDDTTRTLRDFLSEEYHAKKVDSHLRMFGSDNLPRFYVQGLRYLQHRHSDLHMLRYIERFFNDFFKKGVCPENWEPYYDIKKVRSKILQHIESIGGGASCI